MNASASNGKQERGGEPKRAFTTARIVALVVIGVVVLALGYVHVSSGDDAVSVPSGAKAGDLILDDCQYATEQGDYDADCGTLVVPENRHEATAPDRASRDPRPRSLGGSRRADLPPPGRSRDHEHDVPGRESVRRQARRRAGRLPRRRRRVEARLSRGHIGARAGARLPHREGDARRRGGVQGLRGAPPGRRRSTSPDTRFPSASTTSTRPARRWVMSASTCSARAPGRARR